VPEYRKRILPPHGVISASACLTIWITPSSSSNGGFSTTLILVTFVKPFQHSLHSETFYLALHYSKDLQSATSSPVVDVVFKNDIPRLFSANVVIVCNH
jgi:hypothetical protein